MRKFEVQEGLMGFAVVIGCQMCFFSTKEELAEKVKEYILHPEATEEKYYKPKAGMEIPPPQPPQAYAGEEIRPVAAVERAIGLRRG